MIPEEVIEKIKYENDIVDVISETVRLKRAGRNYLGLCPFHNEKTPSFSVSPDKQIFKCFGCGEAGNVITFIMKTKNKTFPEACEYLADRANIEINISEKDQIQKSKYEKLFKINVDAARYFFNNLRKNKVPMDYFIRRGINSKTINKFGLGYAENNWNGLYNYLRSKGYSELDMLSLGLIRKNSNNSFKNNYYDLFKNRVIFPIIDIKGKVIGFGGRVLDDSKPKYLNSPETTLFKKGTNLYGLNLAMKSNKRQIIIVEGYMDCISLHQSGITNVVASLGTALTSKQAKLLKRYADEIIISYDADAAGQAATVRGLEILRKEGLNVKVLTVPNGKDPDEFIKNNGSEAFKKLIENAVPLIEYRIKKAGENINFKNEEQLVKYMSKISEIVMELDPIEKDIHIKKISENTKISQQAIYDLLNNQLQKNVKNPQNMNSNIDFRPKLYIEPPYIKAERSLLKLMLNEEAYEIIINKINSDHFINYSHKKIFNTIIDAKSKNNDIKAQNIEVKLDDIDTTKEWIYIYDTDIISENTEDLYAYIDDCIDEIQKFKLEESRKKIMSNIKEYEAKGMMRESLELVQQLMEIEKMISQIKAGERR